MTEISSDTHTAAPRDALDGVGVLLYLLAAAVAVGAVVTGCVLMSHGVCGVNPYDANLTDCSQKTHPFAGAGAAVFVGGCIQAVLLAAVGGIARAVGQLRHAA